MAIAGILGIIAGAAAVAIRWRAGRELRRPTKTQLDDMATPIGRILLRHTDASWINKDLFDVVAAGTALGSYVNDGPLTTQLIPDPGMPADLQETHA